MTLLTAVAVMGCGGSGGGGGGSGTVLPPGNNGPPPPPPPGGPPAPYQVASPSLVVFVDAPFSVSVQIVDSTNAPVAAPSDLAVVVAAAPTVGLSPRVLNGTITKGTSSTVIAGASVANAGAFALDVTVGTVSGQALVTVQDRVLAGAYSAEVPVDLGGPGIAGHGFSDLAALDSQAACAFTDQRVVATAAMSHVFVTSTQDGGQTFTAAPVRADRAPDATDCWDPGVAVDGNGLVAVGWCDARSFAQGAVYLNVSTNGGTTFGANDVRVDMATSRADLCSGVRVATGNGRIYAVWSDVRSATLGGNVYFSRSLDGGQTFPAETQLDNHTGLATVVTPLGLVAAGDDVCVAWLEQDGASALVNVAASQDGGATFSAPVALNGTPTANVYDLRLALSGGALHVAWRDDRANAGTLVYTRSSTDGGMTWGGEVLVSVGATKANVSSLSLAAAGSNVVISFEGQDFGGTTDQVFVAQSSDGGATFTATTGNAIAQGTSDSVRNPQVAAESTTVYASWNEVNYTTGPRATTSVDGGVTFGAPVKIGGSVAIDGLFWEGRAVAATNGTAYVLWEESRGSPGTASHLFLVVAR